MVLEYFLTMKGSHMKKITLPIILTLAALSACANPVAAPMAPVADPAARIAALEARIADLEKRMHALEQKSPRHNIVIEHRRRNPAVFVCSASVFGKTYEAADRNEGLARIQVRKACQAEQDDMFCRDSRISCKQFD